MPLRDSVLESIRKVSTKSIPAYVEHGLRELRKDAATIQAARGIVEMNQEDQPQSHMRSFVK
jgi:hypothetical protein